MRALKVLRVCQRPVAAVVGRCSLSSTEARPRDEVLNFVSRVKPQVVVVPVREAQRVATTLAGAGGSAARHCLEGDVAPAEGVGAFTADQLCDLFTAYADLYGGAGGLEMDDGARKLFEAIAAALAVDDLGDEARASLVAALTTVGSAGFAAHSAVPRLGASLVRSLVARPLLFPDDDDVADDDDNADDDDDADNADAVATLAKAAEVARLAAAVEIYDPKLDTLVSRASVAALARLPLAWEDVAILTHLTSLASSFASTPRPAKDHAGLYDAVVAASVPRLTTTASRGQGATLRRLATTLVETLAKAGLLARYPRLVDAFTEHDLLDDLSPCEAELLGNNLALRGADDRHDLPLDDGRGRGSTDAWILGGKPSPSSLADSLRRLGRPDFRPTRGPRGIPLALGNDAEKRAVLYADESCFRKVYVADDEVAFVPKADRFRVVRLLRDLSWDVVVIPFYEWHADDHDLQDTHLALKLDTPPALRRLDFSGGARFISRVPLPRDHD